MTYIRRKRLVKHSSIYLAESSHIQSEFYSGWGRLSFCEMSCLVSLALFFLVFSQLNAFGNAANLTSVCLNDGGCILGKLENGNKESYEAYYGIPFAEPPTGQRRFEVHLQPFDCISCNVFKIYILRIRFPGLSGKTFGMRLIPEVRVSKGNLFPMK